MELWRARWKQKTKPQESNASSLSLHHGANYNSISPAAIRHEFRFLYLAQLRLILRKNRWWWYGIASVLALAPVFGRSAHARGLLLALAWMWPVLTWSEMGVCEIESQVSAFLFSSPKPLIRQLLSLWLAGWTIASAIGLPFAIYQMAIADWPQLAGWLVGTIFIASVALFAGVWSSSHKTFQLIFLLLFFSGPMRSDSRFDFMSAAPVTPHTVYPLIFLALAVLMLALSPFGRMYQMRSAR